MKLSIVIPVYNEIKYIEELFASLMNIDYPDLELLFVDGGSTDGTLEYLKKQIPQINKEIKVINNPSKFVSHGFNQAYKLCRGRFISLIGAHSLYPSNYFRKCIEEISANVCDVAGGKLTHKGKSIYGKAIAACLNSIFGVGDTAFRTSNQRKFVDSVAFAVYDRKVFEACGLLDEELVRNQDDEFHYRLNHYGFKILMIPELSIIYFVRDSIEKLFTQYFQYGLYKPLVLKKVPSEWKWRHLIPSLFVLYLISLPLALIFPLWILPFLLYVFLDIYFSFKASAPWQVRLRMLLVYPVLHIAYGAGFLAGLTKIWYKKR